MKTVKVFNIATDNLNDFRTMAEKAKALGATHVMAGQMPRSRWMWEQDLNDPYPNWSMGHAQLFKLVCPPELKDFLPQDHINECFALFKARCDILKEIGLKPALFSNEPFWLPEEVYRKHPAWRGARCDHPRRSHKPYYSPCIDHPEVLAMYRYAVRELCKQTGLDFIHFMSNDSGGGLCWSSGTYVGPNGPMACKEHSMADRVTGFINAISDGAKDAGIDAIVHFNSDIDFKEKEISVSTACPKLKENQIVNKMNHKSEVVVTSITDVGAPGHPVRKIPQMVKFVRFAKQFLSAKTPVTIVDIPRSDFDEACLILEYAKQQELHDISDCFLVLKKAAEQIVGTDYAGTLTDAWYHIDEAYDHVSHTGLDLIMYGCQHQRWINRPFVLFPMELKEEDRAYYRKYQFQALSEEEANDLLNLQGIEGVRGFTAVFMLTETMKKAIRSMTAAISEISVLAYTVTDSTKKQKFLLLKKRLEVERCFFRNIIHAAQFQELVDRTDFENPPARMLRWPTRNDSRIEEYQNIMRSEIDNSYELAGLLQEDLTEVLLCTSPEKEDIFVFSTNFAEQMKHKAEIMLDHMNDGSRVYETHNI